MNVGMVPASLCCVAGVVVVVCLVPLPVLLPVVVPDVVVVSASFNSVAKDTAGFCTEEEAGRKSAAPPTLRRFFLRGVMESEAGTEVAEARERRFAGEAVTVVVAVVVVVVALSFGMG